MAQGERETIGAPAVSRGRALPLGQISRSLIGKLVLLLLVFIAVPIILYAEFRQADADKRTLLRARRGALAGGGGERLCRGPVQSGVGLFSGHGRRTQRLGGLGLVPPGRGERSGRRPVRQHIERKDTKR